MISVVGVLASLLTCALTAPQVWATCRHRRTAGLSSASLWLAAANSATWLLYGLLVGDRVQIGVNAVVGAGNAAIVASAVRVDVVRRSRATLLRAAAAPVGGVMMALLLALLTALGPLTAAETGPLIGMAGAVVGMLSALPQPVSLLRFRTQDTSGVSVARWILGGASGLGWASYGVLAHQPAVWITALTTLAGALAVLALVQQQRRRTPPEQSVALAA